MTYKGWYKCETNTEELDEAVMNRLISRILIGEIKKVEYSLTERGKSLIPNLDSMCDWGEKHHL